MCVHSCTSRCVYAYGVLRAQVPNMSFNSENHWVNVGTILPKPCMKCSHPGREVTCVGELERGPRYPHHLGAVSSCNIGLRSLHDRLVQSKKSGCSHGVRTSVNEGAKQLHGVPVIHNLEHILHEPRRRRTQYSGSRVSQVMEALSHREALSHKVPSL
jgi:hypothetical protein